MLENSKTVTIPDFDDMHGSSRKPAVNGDAAIWFDFLMPSASRIEWIFEMFDKIKRCRLWQLNLCRKCGLPDHSALCRMQSLYGVEWKENVTAYGEPNKRGNRTTLFDIAIATDNS